MDYKWPNTDHNSQLKEDTEFMQNELGHAICVKENGVWRKTENDKFLIVYNIKFEHIGDPDFVNLWSVNRH